VAAAAAAAAVAGVKLVDGVCCVVIFDRFSVLLSAKRKRKLMTASTHTDWIDHAMNISDIPVDRLSITN